MQPLTGWTGDIASLLREMKARAGVKTDLALAQFMGLAQSTVANWRQRGAVPEAALLAFEERLATSSPSPTLRALFARAVALRVPELWLARMNTEHPQARETAYLSVATCFNAMVEAARRNIEKIEVETGLTTAEVGRKLINDDIFLNGMVDWMEGVSAAEMLLLEAEASEAIRSHG